MDNSLLSCDVGLYMVLAACRYSSTFQKDLIVAVSVPEMDKVRDAGEGRCS